MLKEQNNNSTFRAVSNNLRLISQKLIDNEEICKLLYYNSSSDNDIYRKPCLTTEQKETLIKEGYIQILPRIKVNDDNAEKNCIHINFDDFSISNNPKYINSILAIDIVCCEDSLVVKRHGEIYLRQYELAYFVMKEICSKKFTGIGVANFSRAENLMVASDQKRQGVTLYFELTDYGA